MVPYESKVMNVEDDILNFFPIRQNRKDYTRKYKNWGDESRMIIIDDGHLCDTVIADNIDLIRNNILESRYLVLSYLQIGLHTADANYSI